MKKRSSVIAYTLAAVLALSNLSPAAVYAAETEAANAAAASCLRGAEGALPSQKERTATFTPMIRSAGQARKTDC